MLGRVHLSRGMAPLAIENCLISEALSSLCGVAAMPPHRGRLKVVRRTYN
jgi:hypothetical protein